MTKQCIRPLRHLSPEGLKSQFDEVAATLWAARTKLEQMGLSLSRTDDQTALRSILTDLTWACENCTVIGLHQLDKALDDTMGFGVAE